MLWLATLLMLAPLPSPDEVRAYNQAGVDILAGLRSVERERLGHWDLGPPERVGGVTRQPWVRGQSEGAVRPGRLKLVSVDPPNGTGEVEAVIRYEREALGRIDRGFFQTRWRGGGLLRAALVHGETVIGAGKGLSDQAAARGLDFVSTEDPRFQPPSTQLAFQIIRHAVGGAAAADVNGDGAADLMLTRGTDARFFLNDGRGNFSDATEAVGLAGIDHANVTLFADFDGDGDPDLVTGHFYGRNRLFENNGGRFHDVTAASGLAPDDMSATMTAADFNGDGHLDLYIGRFLDARTTIPTMIHYSRNGAPNRLYLGQGDLKFRDVSAGSGADDTGLTLGLAAGDVDGDGDTDLYLANDFGRNVLLINRGDATFEDKASEHGALAISAGMSAALGDYDADGVMDLYVSSIRSNQRWFSTPINIRAYVLKVVQTERREALQPLFLDLKRHLGDDWDGLGQRALSGNLLLRGVGGGHFTDVSEAANARPFGWYWSSGFYDVDNDGALDILATNGWITGPNKHDL